MREHSILVMYPGGREFGVVVVPARDAAGALKRCGEWLTQTYGEGAGLMMRAVPLLKRLGQPKD